MKRARSLKIHIMLKLFSLLADVGHTIDTFIFRPHIISAHIASDCIELWNPDMDVSYFHIVESTRIETFSPRIM